MYIDQLFNLSGKVAAVIGAGGHLCSEMARSFCSCRMQSSHHRS